jgi:septal ring factor EnvC (AmiA/AmiB activator)
MVNLKNHIVVLFLIFVVQIFAQNNDSISQKNAELDRVKNEINELEKELKTKTSRERETLAALENLNRQKLLINKLINNYRNEEESKSLEIVRTESNISDVEKKISQLKKSYSNYVVWLYKNRGFSSLRFIFDADSYSQAIMRYKYFELITEQNKKTLAQLNSNKNELFLLKEKLIREKSEKERLVNQKLSEQEILTIKESERKEIINALKNDKKLIAEEIDSKRKAEIAIKNIIAKLVDEERLRRSRLKEKRTADNKLVASYNYEKLTDFEQLKGKLGWPVSSGKIVRKFGENKNERLKTVTLNYGIDLEVKQGIDVKAVAEGIVSAIDWIPGYGSVLIVTHRNEYRTVYGHVSDIKVTEGQKVTPGMIIANVNESLEGNILHFEIWSERNYQNPELWLAKK